MVSVEDQGNDRPVLLDQIKTNYHEKKIKFSKIKYSYFKVESDQLLKPVDVYKTLLSNKVNSVSFYVEKILKKSSSFLRIGVIKSENIRLICLILRTSLKVTLKKLYSDVQSQKNIRPVLKTESITVLTLNVNSLDSKIEELYERIQRHKPTIICLQETRKIDTGKKVYISGIVLSSPIKTKMGWEYLLEFEKTVS
jgi:hypothetical protein